MILTHSVLKKSILYSYGKQSVKQIELNAFENELKYRW